MEQLFNEEESGQVYIAGGFAHPELTAQIAESVGIYPGPLKEKIHPNGEIYVRYEDSVRGNHVFVVQSHIGAEGTSVNDAIMEQCLMIDAAKRSSAKEITAVAPYLAYGRQDRKTKGREPIAAAVTQGIFQGPFDHLTAQPLLRDAMKEEIAEYEHDDCIVVAPDAGAAKLSEQHRTDLDMGMFVMTKLRDPNDNQKISRDDKFPDADGRVCLVFDDMVDTAGTLVSAAEALNNSGAKAVYVAATHGVLSDPALERLKNAPIKKILITDTFVTERAQKELGDKLRIVSVAPMIGRAIIEIVRCGSVSEIFQDQNNR
jgi:ribose-phosphate pyrophosphokinase